MSLLARLHLSVVFLGMAFVGYAHADGSFPDSPIGAPPTLEVIQKGRQVIGDYMSQSQPTASYRVPLNQIDWARTLADPSATDMPTANNDTLYMSAVVNLTEPYVLTVPDTQDRDYVINVVDMWQELEHYIGRRTTGTKRAKFVLVPPGWKGALPKDAKRLDVSTSKVLLWGRLRVIQGEDIAKLAALQKQFKLAPLSGKPRLNGDNRYTSTFSKGSTPPINGLGSWSWTMYDPRHFFVATRSSAIPLERKISGTRPLTPTDR